MSNLIFRWRLLAVLALLTGILTPLVGMAAGLLPTPETRTWITNGPVRATVATPGAVYLGGQFTQVGPRTGCGVPLDAATGTPVATYPRVDCLAGGSVNASISDGSGGWFIGGDFFQVDGLPISGIAHIKADGTVDETWIVEMNYGPYAMSLSPDGATLYLGGPFSQVEGVARVGLAAVNAATGALLPWDPGTDGEVHALAVTSDGTVIYASGYFSQAGGQASQNLVAINAATGAGTAMVANPNESIRSMALAADGLTLYIGGDFSLLGGFIPFPGVARVSTATGMPDLTWVPDAVGGVYGLILDEANGLIYLGGSFSSVGGAARNGIAAADLATGLPTAWNPDAGSGNVYALGLSADGATIYAGGSFTTMGGEIRTRLAAIDTATGTPSDWNPIAANTVSTLAVAGGTVYVGGGFQSIGGCLRNSLAAIHPVSGRALDFNPGPDNPGGADEIYALAVSPDHQTLYVGGNFTSLGGEAHENLGSVDAVTGLARPWQVDVQSLVHALALSGDGQTLYLGGAFNVVGTEPRNNLAAVNAATGAVAAWNPDLDAPAHAVTLSHDGTKLYAGGTFASVGAQPRQGLARFSADTGALDPWQADVLLGVDTGRVSTLVLAANDGTIYVGGLYDRIGGVARSHLAALDAAAVTVTTWNPAADEEVNALALVGDGATLYAGGQFRNIGGGARIRLAALDTVTAAAAAWNPAPDSSILAIAFGPSEASLFAGGYFSRWGSDLQAQSGLAQFLDPDLTAPLIMAAAPPGNGTTVPAAGTYAAPVDAPFAIAATPATDYLFIGWTVAGPGLVADALAASTTLTLTADLTVTVTANFSESTRLTLAVNPADRGTTVPAAGAHTVSVGMPQAISATPIIGWHFTQWSLDAGNADIANTMTAATSVTVTDAGGATITANFSKNQYTVTFQTDGTPGAGIAGTLVQVVDHGCDAGTVTAQSPVGYAFLHWTLDGVAYSAGAALQVMGVTRNMTLVAKFAAEGDAATLNLAAEGGGSTQPVPGALLVEVNQGVGVVAVPDPGYEFFGWEVTVGNAILGDAVSAATVVTVTDAAGATLTATFGQHAVLTLGTASAEGGSVAPDGAVTVVVGESTAVSAIANPGWELASWEVVDGDAEIAAPLAADTVITVTSAAGATVVANFAELERVALGSLFTAAADDLGLPGGFTAKPRIYAFYDHPLNDKLGLKANAKVLTKVEKTGTPSVDCEWTKKIKLYDAKAFKADRKAGTSVEDWLPLNQRDLPLSLHGAGRNIPEGDQPLRNALLSAPTILTATDSHDGDIRIVEFEGWWFGTKTLKAWREYWFDDGENPPVLMVQKLKVRKPTEADAAAGFADRKGKPAYMNTVTGASRAIVEIPGSLNGVFVIDNGVGLSTWRFIED